MTSREVLEDALLHYAGAVVVVSHDRYFMSQVANRLCVFGNGNVEVHDCDYFDYIDKLHKKLGTDTTHSDIKDSLEAVLSLKEKIKTRYIDGDSKYRISSAKSLKVTLATAANARSKNFGGSGVPSGDPFKGIKNAKRFAN